VAYLSSIRRKGQVGQKEKMGTKGTQSELYGKKVKPNLILIPMIKHASLERKKEIYRVQKVKLKKPNQPLKGKKFPPVPRRESRAKG